MDPALVSLTAAAIAFTGGHFVLSHPLRAPLVKVLGEKPFLGLYSLLVLGAFAWMVFAFRAVPPGGLPTPVGGLGDAIWVLASLLTLVAGVLLIGSFAGNPALPDTPAAKVATAKARGVFAVTRHPMMWSFALWAIAHLLLFWSLRTLIVTVAILILALVGSHLQDRKKEALQGEAWKHWEAQTSYWPRWGRLLSVGPVPLFGGLALWLAATYGHIHAAGIPAGIWRWIGIS